MRSFFPLSLLIPVLISFETIFSQATTPLTLFELGFERNHSVPLMRLLRNRGVLAAMPIPDKVNLAIWLLYCRSDIGRGVCRVFPSRLATLPLQVCFG